jgi:hypothetical protein
MERKKYYIHLEQFYCFNFSVLVFFEQQVDNFTDLKNQVLNLVEEHNKWLQEELLKPKYDYDY